MRVAGAPVAGCRLVTSVVRSVGQAGNRQAGPDDVPVLFEPLGEHPGDAGDDRVLVAVGAHRADAGAAGDGLALGYGLGPGEDALGRRHDDLEVRRVLALPV